MALGNCGLNITDDLKELQPHGTPQFPCAGYESFHDTVKDDDIPWHRHEEIEIIHILKGSMRLRIPNDEIIVHAGEVVFINSDVAHFSDAIEAYDLNSYVFSPLLVTGSKTSAFAEKYISPLTACNELPAVLIQNQDAVTVFHEAFEKLRCDSFGYEFAVRDALSKLLLMTFAENRALLTFTESEDDTDSQRLDTMLAYIHDHHHEPITLSDIASSADIGERECLRCFKRKMSESPVQYLMKYRMMRSASVLLAQPSMNITEVAQECGFSSSSYYTELFKRYYKVTPKEFRKNNA